jgi:hypothetical protein
VRGAGRRGGYGRRCCGRIRQPWEILRDPSPLVEFFLEKKSYEVKDVESMFGELNQDL